MSGDRDRAIATSYEVNVSPGYGADQSAYATFYEMATALPTPVPVIMLQAQALQAHDTLDRLGEISAPTLVIHGTEDEMLPVPQRGADRLADPGRPPRDARGRRPHVLVGAARALRGGDPRASTARPRGAGAHRVRAGARRRARRARPTTTRRMSSLRPSAFGSASSSRSRPCWVSPSSSALNAGSSAGSSRSRRMREARPFGGERARDRVEDLERGIGLAAAVQQAAERDRRVGPARLKLERAAQRRLVAGLDQVIGLAGHEGVEEALDRGRRLHADELGRRPGRP